MTMKEGLIWTMHRKRKAVRLIFAVFAVAVMGCAFALAAEQDPDQEQVFASVLSRQHDRDYSTSEDSDVQKILDDADSWLADFQAEQAEVSFTGQAYYVSNTGDDQADGRSPETAWATIGRALSEPPAAGDCILLERGCSWRISDSGLADINSDTLQFPEGVSLGAYGEGERPLISGEAEDGSLPTSWELFCEEGGKRIWKFHRNMRNTCVIVLNGGETWADCVMPWLAYDDKYIDRNGNPFSPEEMLVSDLTFCTLLDHPGRILDGTEGSAMTGALYFRCDAGNPAEVYREVAIPQVCCGVSVLENSAVAGISFRYFTCTAVGLADYDRLSIEGEKKFYSNEVAWCGGLLSSYIENGTAYLNPYTAGGALQTSGEDLTISGNWLHDCGPMTNIISLHVDNDRLELTEYKNIEIRDNLIVRCGAGFHWADFTSQDMDGAKGLLTNIHFEENYVLYSGSGWVAGMLEQENWEENKSHWFSSAVENQMGAGDIDGMFICGNVLCFSEGYLIDYSDYVMGNPEWTVNQRPVFSGNTYVYSGEHAFAMLNNQEANAETFLSEMGDTDSTVLMAPMG